MRPSEYTGREVRESIRSKYVGTAVEHEALKAWCEDQNWNQWGEVKAQLELETLESRSHLAEQKLRCDLLLDGHRIDTCIREFLEGVDEYEHQESIMNYRFDEVVRAIKSSGLPVADLERVVEKLRGETDDSEETEGR